jgi:hypothetical protein
VVDDFLYLLYDVLAKKLDFAILPYSSKHSVLWFWNDTGWYYKSNGAKLFVLYRFLYAGNVHKRCVACRRWFVKLCFVGVELAIFFYEYVSAVFVDYRFYVVLDVHITTSRFRVDVESGGHAVPCCINSNLCSLHVFFVQFELLPGSRVYGLIVAKRSASNFGIEEDVLLYDALLELIYCAVCLSYRDAESTKVKTHAATNKRF